MCLNKQSNIVFFGCDSSPRSPNVSLSVCVYHTCYNCTKALNIKVFRLKDFQRTSKGLSKDLQVAAPRSSRLVLSAVRLAVESLLSVSQQELSIANHYILRFLVSITDCICSEAFYFYQLLLPIHAVPPQTVSMPWLFSRLLLLFISWFTSYISANKNRCQWRHECIKVTKIPLCFKLVYFAISRYICQRLQCFVCKIFWSCLFQCFFCVNLYLSPSKRNH